MIYTLMDKAESLASLHTVMWRWMRIFGCVTALSVFMTLFLVISKPEVFTHLSRTSSRLLLDMTVKPQTPRPDSVSTQQNHPTQARSSPTSRKKVTASSRNVSPKASQKAPAKVKKPLCQGNHAPTEKFEVYKGPVPPDVTVVSAYFNLGRFQKGGAGFFDTPLYMRWATVFQYLRSPFVFYTDSNDTYKMFQEMRKGLDNITKIILVDRQSLWAFDWKDRIKKIYADPKYPKFHPNTVVSGYTCAQHAKYNVVELTVKQNYFNTSYFTWIDVGYFRHILPRKKHFVMIKPKNFNESRVAMNKVYDRNMKTPVANIFKKNLVWMGGGLFFGSKFSLPTFIEDYRYAVDRYLNMSLSSTDQQVIFAMNTVKEKNILKQRVPLQQYIPDVRGDCWFYLGYLCYRELA